MTSELQTRPARSRYSAASDTHAADDGAQQRPGRTHGRPRRSRERRRAAAMAALRAVPVLVMGGIAATVLHGYHESVAARETSTAEPTTRPADVAAPPADLAAHAPKDTGGLGTTEGLTPQLTRAITRAREAAAADGIERIGITSGARSAQAQQQLFVEAVAKYGSAAEASKWVLPPNKSAHVKGEAIDVNPYAAAQWLEKNGVKFGLCRRYANEYWHFEVLAPAKGQKCPALEANAAHTE